MPNKTMKMRTEDNNGIKMAANRVINRPKTSTNEILTLERSTGSSSDLITIKSTKKKQMEEEIVSSLSTWMDNPIFNDFKTELLDVAIVIYVDKNRMKKQDLDNIAKVVLDALKKSKDDSKPYLFEDDSQVVRLLLYKLEKTELIGYDTSSIVISFRKHDPNQQMILENSKKNENW